MFPPPISVAYLNFECEKNSASLSLIDREVESLYTHESIVFHLLLLLSLLLFIFVKENPSSSVIPRFEFTSLRQKVSRLPTEPPERPVEL